MSLGPRPDSNLRCRRVELSEARRLAEFAARTFTDAFASQNHPEDMAAYVNEAFSVERIEAELRAPESFFLLAFDSGRASTEPVGYSRLVAGAPNDDITGPTPIELHRLYVDGEARGSGYGSALMWDTLELARGSGYRTVWLGVWEENLGARRFYERWGFDVVGSQEFVLGGDRQRDLLMARSLD